MGNKNYVQIKTIWVPSTNLHLYDSSDALTNSSPHSYAIDPLTPSRESAENQKYCIHMAQQKSYLSTSITDLAIKYRIL